MIIKWDIIHYLIFNFLFPKVNASLVYKPKVVNQKTNYILRVVVCIFLSIIFIFFVIFVWAMLWLENQKSA